MIDYPYKVLKGDTFYGIAKAKKVSPADLLAANPSIRNIDNILEGLTLTIPTGNTPVKTATLITTPKTQTPATPATQSSFRKLLGNISDARYNLIVSKVSTIRNYLKKKGLQDFNIAGIMGNMAQESMFDENAKHGTYLGLVLMSSDLWKKLGEAYGTSLNGQLNYIADYALGKVSPKYSGTLGYKQSDYQAGNHKTAGDSAHTWAYNFERAYIVKKDAAGRPIRNSKGKLVFVTNADGTYKIQELAQRQAFANALYEHFNKMKFGGVIYFQ